MNAHVYMCACVCIGVARVFGKLGWIFMTVDKYAPNMDREHNESKVGDNKCEWKNT